MGLHGNALEVDRVGAQYLGGVYWKTWTNTPKRDKGGEALVVKNPISKDKRETEYSWFLSYLLNPYFVSKMGIRITSEWTNTVQ